MTARKLGVLVRQLPEDAALVRVLNDGRPQWTTAEHLLADLWALWAKKDHPKRAEREAKARAALKEARVIELRTKFEHRKRTYGMG